MAKVINYKLDRANGETMFGGGKGIISLNSSSWLTKRQDAASSGSTPVSPDDSEPKNAEGVLLQIVQAQMIEESKAEQSTSHTEMPPKHETKIEPSPPNIPGKAIEPNQERTTE